MTDHIIEDQKNFTDWHSATPKTRRGSGLDIVQKAVLKALDLKKLRRYYRSKHFISSKK